MCGICGIAFIDDRSPEEGLLLRMNRKLVHRGPDDEGYFIAPGIGFGMRRLKVIDLETGGQPMFNENKDVCVVYNGEIYNFQELREELEKSGHLFHSKSDTEVLVHLYEEYGIGFVNKLNGMFAFALWDNKNKLLYLVRDQFGIKPLYYALLKDCIIFGSELKSLLEYKLDKELDNNSLAKYMMMEFVPSPACILKGVKKLPPAHLLKFHRGSVEVKNYWTLNLENKKVDIDFDDAKEELVDLLRDAVKIRLISDVPLGAFLSGGIDSSTVVFFMKETHNTKIKTFSISFDDPSFDESEYSNLVSSHLGTEHHDRRMSEKDLISAIPKVFSFLDEPIGDASIVPTYLLSAFARERVTVALSGDAGDELFAGYPTYFAHRIAEGYSRFVPALFHKNILKIANLLPVSFDNFSIDFKIKRFFNFSKQESLRRNIFWLGSFSEDELNELLLCPFDRKLLYDEQFGTFSRYSYVSDVVERLQVMDFFYYLQEDVLVKVDRASMACSLEVRIPYLDPRVVEFVWSLPFGMKMNKFRSKYILKRAMEKRLPERIINRPKKGFGIPVAKWFSTNLKELVLDTFNESVLKNDGILNSRYIHKLLNEHFNKKVDHRKKLWTLFVFQHWLKHYGKS